MFKYLLDSYLLKYIGQVKSICSPDLKVGQWILSKNVEKESK